MLDYPGAWLELTGAWLNKIDQLSWGTALKVAVTRRAKNEATGEWETVGRDYYDVTLAEGITIPSDITEGSQVNIAGFFSTGKIYDKKDGTQGFELKLRGVKQISLYVPKHPAGSAATSDSIIPAGWAEVDPDDRRKYGSGVPF